MQLQFDEIALNVRPHAVHEWALTTAEVAAGFGVDDGNIRYHKSVHTDELIEGKHFVSVRNPNAVGNQAETWWTKRGVVRLGFFIKSDRAKRFRDWAEDLVVAKTAEAPSLPQTYKEALQALLVEVEQKELLLAENEALRPKALYADAVLSSTTELTTTVIAQELGMSAIKLNKHLHMAGVQYTWVLYSVHVDKDYAHLKTHAYTDSAGKPQTKHYLVWTEKGREFIHRTLNRKLIQSTSLTAVRLGLPTANA